MPNAYEVNPQMMQGLAEITPENLPFFLFSNPEIVPEAFNKKFQKNLKGCISTSALTVFSGIVLNMITTRVLPQVLILHPSIRFPLRLGILFSPLILTFSKISNHYEHHIEMFE